VTSGPTVCRKTSRVGSADWPARPLPGTVQVALVQLLTGDPNRRFHHRLVQL